MARRIRTQEQVAGWREAAAIAATLGGTVRSARRTRGWSIAALARKVGISTARLSDLERGQGARAPLETWISIGVALGRPIAMTFSREQPRVSGLSDAGHLQIQEHVLRLAAATGRPGTFELPTRPGDPSRSTDVGIRDPTNHARILVECWNTFGDLGAAVRATRRKEQEAAATWPEDRIATVWVVRASSPNRALFERYPHVIDSAFPGSSRAWLRALVEAEQPPTQPGIVWFDSSKKRLVERRAGPSRAKRRATIGA